MFDCELKLQNPCSLLNDYYSSIVLVQLTMNNSIVLMKVTTE